MDHLAANLATLDAAMPMLARTLREVVELPGAEPIATRDGDWTARVALPDGAAATLHSRYNARQEAERLVGEVDPHALRGFLVLGFGLGYHLEALLERCSPGSEVVVVDKHPGVVKLAARLRDLRKVFSDRRVTWVLGLERQEVYQVLCLRQAELLMSLSMTKLEHPASIALDPDYYEEARAAIRDFLLSGQVTLGSHFMLAHQTVSNEMMNLPRYAGSASLAELRGLYAGRPGIVVSAGPSLRKNLDGLRRARNRAVLVACDVVLKPLLEHGVVPDFTAIVDFQGQTKKFFETLPPRVGTRLVAIAPAFHRTVAFYPGPVAFAGDPLLDSLLGEAARDMGGHHGGNNVGHFCYLIAGHLGLEPIAFVGQDLGYPLNLTHVPGTPLHEEWQNERNRFYTLEMRELEDLLRKRKELRKVPSQDGGEIFTERNMYHYLRDLELAIKASGRRTLDCTEGGARKQGAEAMPLAEFLDSCPEQDLPAPGAGPAGLDGARLAAAAKVLEHRLLEFLEVKAAVEQKLRTHRRIQKAFAENEPAERYLKSAVEMGERIQKHEAVLAVLQALTPKGFFNAAKAIRKLEAEGLAGDEKVRAQFERDDQLIKALAGSVAYFEPLLRRAIKDCAALAEGREAAP